MSVKKTMRWCVLSFAMMCGFARADEFIFTGSGGDQDWANAANWTCTNKSDEKVLPGGDDKVRFRSATVRITTAVTVGYLQGGAGGTSEVVIDGGSLLVVGAGVEWFNSASYNRPGRLIVKNGGSATFSRYFMVGYKNFQGGRVEIYDGTVRVADTYFHNRLYAETAPLDTRTTIYTGGLLEVGKLELNSGVLNVAGGTLIIKKAVVEDLNQWIEGGRIVAMGGAEGWIIKVTVDPATGYTVLVAESVEPVTVGMIRPFLPRFGI